MSYYAPTLFQDSLGMDQEQALFVGCFLQVWYIIASFLTVCTLLYRYRRKLLQTDSLKWYMIDSVGRRRLFIIMAMGMCIVLVCEAITVAIDNKPSGIAAVFFVFAFEACFTWGKLHSLLSVEMIVMHVDTR